MLTRALYFLEEKGSHGNPFERKKIKNMIEVGDVGFKNKEIKRSLNYETSSADYDVRRRIQKKKTENSVDHLNLYKYTKKCQDLLRDDKICSCEKLVCGAQKKCGSAMFGFAMECLVKRPTNILDPFDMTQDDCSCNVSKLLI